MACNWNGLIVQWKIVTGTSISADGSYTWTYPLTYNNKPCVLAQWITPSSSSYTRNNITSLSTTSCTVRGTDSSKSGIVLFAIGI